MNDILPPDRLPKPQNSGSRPPRPLYVPPRPSVVAQPAPAEPLDLPKPAPDLSRFTKKPRRRLKWVLIILAILVIILGAAAVEAYSWYKNALTPYSASQQRIKITVPSGATPDQVAATLASQKVIKSALALQIYIKLQHIGDIKAGSYVFTQNQSPQEILQWLVDGKIDTFKVTILPGQTLAEIKQTLISDGYSAQDVDQAYAHNYNHPLLADKPANASLEGYIYPDTYYANSDTTLESIFSQSFDEFQKKIDAAGLKPKLSSLGFNVYQGITLASIIEKEVSSSNDQHQVAQVFELRLKQGMMLGSDVTYHYAASLLGVAPSPTLDSPYNTRLYKGLPPGPISNFGLGALDAVANPSSGSYLFFVAGDDGVTHFATTEAEHEANVTNYCQKLCASN